MRNPGGGEHVITSRLLILQSKRLLLHSAQRRLQQTGIQSMRRRVEALRLETDMAQHSYRLSVLKWGSPQQPDYWLVAYARLIDMGQALSTKLRAAVEELPSAEHAQVEADVEMLEDIIEHWVESMREAMASAVA